MRTSTDINELATALAKAQGEISAAHKDSDNPFFRSKYADLASVWDACRDPLSKNGLAVVQMPRADGATVTMETRLIHSSGQWIEGELPATAKDDGPQSIGSAVTYLRRYMLQSVAGVAPDDDDGNAAQGKPEERRQSPKRNGRAQQIASDHGMTTADKLPPPKEEHGKTAYQIACEKLLKVDSKDKLKFMEDWCMKNKASMSESEWLDIGGRIADADQRISEPAAA